MLFLQRPWLNLFYLFPTLDPNRMKKLAFIILLFTPIFLRGHAGGHHAAGDLIKVWHLTNGQTIQGNFSFGDGNQIILEKIQGHKVAIPLNMLQQNDRKIAKIKIARYQQIHENETPFSPEIQSKNPYALPQWITLMLMGLLMVYIIRNATNRFILIPAGVTYICLIIWACKTDTAITPSNPGIISPTKTNTSFLDSAFSPYKKTVSTNFDDTYYYVNSNGMPEHNMMVGITSWQQQVPIPQPYSGTNHWSIPLKPVYETSPLSTKSNFMKGAVALAVNGIPIFNALNNRGEDSFAIGELDQWGGHCGRADDYHYHAAPLHLNSTSGLKPIAFALDGFAVYGSKEPDGSAMKALDSNHGHEGTGGVYHYHGTPDYPYVIGSMRGKVTTDPATPAPENQILPQAFTSVVRPALTALKGAMITNFETISPTSYMLTYTLNAKKYTVKYSWVNNNYTFVFTDGDGKQTTETYVRK